MSISTALEARRDALREREAGFTLIELLVVVIIIGILAAIAIPIYIGVQNNAKDASVKSDLTNDKTAIVSAATDKNGLIPSTITNVGLATMADGTTVDLASQGWSKSGNTYLFAYVSNNPDKGSGTWCLGATSTTTKVFYISSNKSVTAGTCPSSASAW